MLTEAALTDRQQREIDYHRDHAMKQSAVVSRPVVTDVISPGPRRWWNAFWSMYDRILAHDVAGKRVLVPGCGNGEDAIRLSLLGAQVSAFDLSPEMVEIARARAAAAGQSIDFGVMPAEQTGYAASSFDMVVFVDILHHVDIARTIAEMRRVLKPGGMIVGDELYTHSALQRIRESAAIEKIAWPLMRRWIYGDDKPYITEDEHKIDETEFAIVAQAMSRYETDWFALFEGRLFPNRLAWASRIDRRVLQLLRPFGARLASRVVFSGTVAK